MREKKNAENKRGTYAALGLVLALLIVVFVIPEVAATTYVKGEPKKEEDKGLFSVKEEPKLDTVLYDKLLLRLAHIPEASSTATSTALSPWPAKGNPYPKPGALLPFKRIIAYYGNFYSTKMGILGEYDRETVLAKLKSEKAAWEAADPETPVVMGIDYIAVTAQGSPQADGTYKLRMPDEHVDRAVDMAREVGGIVILELQIGLSSFEREIPLLEKYFSMPDVHLAIDPEFSMKSGDAPGEVIGTVSADDVNYAIGYLSELVKEHNLPPKILVIHRFTQNMVTGYERIQPTPEVQVVMVMDGWGFGAKKINTYNSVIYPEPVQFTGFKIFYKNDLKPPSTRLLTPAEVLDLTPSPSFIQYQ
jgi:hypothetical protein